MCSDRWGFGSPLRVERKDVKEHRTRTCVCAVVRFEVGALRVGLPTADVVARVRGDSLPWPGAPTAFRLGFLRQAVPAGDHEGLCGMESPQSARGEHTKGEGHDF